MHLISSIIYLPNKIYIPLIFAAVAFLLAYLGTQGMKWVAQKYNILDVPNQRSSHTQPTPRGGGMAIVLTFLLVFAFLPLFIDLDRKIFVGILLTGLAISILGFIDDLYTLKRTPRIIAWIGITIIALLFGIGFKSISVPILGEIKFGITYPIITFVWLIGVTNFFNFIDGVNGLAASETLLISVFMAGIAYSSGNSFVLFEHSDTFWSRAGIYSTQFFQS